MLLGCLLARTHVPGPFVGQLVPKKDRTNAPNATWPAEHDFVLLAMLDYSVLSVIVLITIM